MPNDGISLGRTPRLSISTSQKLILILYALTLAWLCAWVPYERRWHSDGETFRQPLRSGWVWNPPYRPPAEINMPQIRLKMIAATALGIAALLIAGIVGPAWPKVRDRLTEVRNKDWERKYRVVLVAAVLLGVVILGATIAVIRNGRNRAKVPPPDFSDLGATPVAPK